MPAQAFPVTTCRAMPPHAPSCRNQNETPTGGQARGGASASPGRRRHHHGEANARRGARPVAGRVELSGQDPDQSDADMAAVAMIKILGKPDAVILMAQCQAAIVIALAVDVDLHPRTSG